MDFLTTEVTTYKTGCLVNFLPCMAIYICSRPGTLWSDSLTSLPCLWSILRDWMQNRPTLTVWQHIVLWQRGPLSQPACCQAKGAVTCAVCPESAWLVTFLIGNVSTGVVTWSALRCGASGESGKKVAAAPLSSGRHRAAHVEPQIVPLFSQSLTISGVESVLNDARRRYEKCIVLGQ